MKTMPVTPEYLRATAVGRAVKVDRENKAILGYVVAQLGPFKSEGRGAFDAQSLSEIVALGNAARGGLKSRFTHPDMSSDGLGKHLGRSRDFSLGTALDARTGKTVKAVRADLHFDASAFDTPHGDLASYVMALAESDPDALSSSLVLKPARFIEDSKGKLVELSDHQEPPEGITPIWRPRELHASDIVSVGDAVDGLLSAHLSTDKLPLSALWKGAEMLDGLFKDQPREVVEARCKAWLSRYLDRKFGEPAPVSTPRLNAIGLRLREMALEAEKLKKAE